MGYKTEKFDIGFERGKVGPTFDTFEDAQQWCHEECETEGIYINICNIYSVRDADKDWHAPDLYTCIWNRVDSCIEEITKQWNKEHFNNIQA